MSDEINTNYESDPYDDEYELGRSTAVPVRVVKEEGEDQSIVNRIISHDDYAPAIINGVATQTSYVQTRQGWVFDVGMLILATFTAGSVSVYKNFIADEALIYTFPQAGNFQFSKGQLALRYGDQLIFVANTVTGNVTPSMHGNLVRRAWFPEYIM
jgi:hypothetical protein